VNGQWRAGVFYVPFTAKKAWVKWHEETFRTFFVKTAVSDFGKYGRPENIFVELLASVGSAYYVCPHVRQMTPHKKSSTEKCRYSNRNSRLTKVSDFYGYSFPQPTIVSGTQH
jgi:hypothetical protein